jgi:hypothetical protein
MCIDNAKGSQTLDIPANDAQMLMTLHLISDAWAIPTTIRSFCFLSRTPLHRVSSSMDRKASWTFERALSTAHGRAFS